MKKLIEFISDYDQIFFNDGILFYIIIKGGGEEDWENILGMEVSIS